MGRIIAATVVFSFAAILLVAPFASAQSTYDPRIQARLYEQDRRIVQGVTSGQLTWKEASFVQREHGRIMRQEVRMKSDGVLTSRERARLHHQLDNAGRHIYRLKHNSRDRFGY
jgi:hypothetical protein